MLPQHLIVSEFIGTLSRCLQRAERAPAEVELSTVGQGAADIDVGLASDRKRKRMWDKGFNSNTLTIPADMCAPLQKPEVSLRVPFGAARQYDRR